MEQKSLNIRYFIYFVISLSFVVIFLNFLKQKEFKYSLLDYEQKVQKEYLKTFEHYKNISELIYFNEFIKNQNLINILKELEFKEKELIKNQLLTQFEDSFTFYKTLELEETTIYSSKNELILSTNEKSKDNFISKIVDKVITFKKDIIEYEIDKDKVYLIFSKPIFDEKLNFLAVINLRFDFDSLINNLEKNSDFRFKKIVSNEFVLDESFFLNMSTQNRNNLVVDLNRQKDVSLILKEKLIKFPLIFKTLLNSDFYKNSIYLISYDLRDDNQIKKIDAFFDYLMLFLIFILVVIYSLLYKINNFKMQKEFLAKEYEELFEQIDNYILKVETDLEGNITFATKNFCKISGYTKEELIGENVNILKHPDVSDKFFEKLWADLQVNNIWEGEIKNQDKYGNSYWIKAIIFPKYDINRQIVGYNSIRINITDTKQLEKINRLLKEDLSNKLNEIKVKDKTLVDSTKVHLMSKILDSLSHQWKIPISKISFELQKLHKLNQIEIENNIDLELKNLSNMLNEIKYLFNTRNSEKTNLLSVVSEVIFNLKEELEKNGIKVKFDIKPEIYTTISFNEMKNIISNVIKNCLEQVIINKSENILIFITAIDEKIDGSDDVVIKIEDNIKSENKRIFIDEVLNSSDDKYFDKHLYLSKLFVEKNRGIFWCDNTIYSTSYYIKLNKEVYK
jgi:PAS domain S-box-containing protein